MTLHKAPNSLEALTTFQALSQTENKFLLLKDYLRSFQLTVVSPPRFLLFANKGEFLRVEIISTHVQTFYRKLQNSTLPVLSCVFPARNKYLLDLLEMCVFCFKKNCTNKLYCIKSASCYHLFGDISQRQTTLNIHDSI